MDSEQKQAALRKQIDEAAGGRPADFEGWKRRTEATLRSVMGGEHRSVEQFTEVSYAPGMWTDSTPQSYFDNVKASGVREGIAILEGALHELELISPTPPSTDVSQLHPWVAGAIAGLWDDGHHRAAVDEATRAIELRLKRKVGSSDSGRRLVTEAFSPRPPTPTQARLRFDAEEGSAAWNDLHEGAMYFAQGCVMRIRNVLEHQEAEPSRQEAVEQLGSLSLLARWIDEARVVKA